MPRSKKFNIVSSWYTSGIFGKEAAKKMVHDAVDRGWITAEEYAEITSEDYE